MGGCKTMKGLKKFIVVSFAAIAVLGLAATANAANPKVQKTITVQLFKEKKSSPNNAWWVDKATSLIPIRNLKWNAKISEISTSNSKCCIEKRATGAYYLNICAAKTVKPGDKTKVQFVVKQNGNLKVLKTTVKFVKAANPMKEFRFVGKDSTGHNYEKNVLGEFVGIRSYDWSVPAGIDLMRVHAVVNPATQDKEGKIYGVLPCGKEVRLYDGNMYELRKLCAIKVVYKTTKDLANANYFGGYFKEENDSFAGTKRFPVQKYVQVNLKY